MLAVTNFGPALIGLAGVAVGGLLSGGIQYFFTRRREFNEKRMAMRLVDADLARARAVILHCLGPPPHFGPERAVKLELSAWNERRGVLALRLSDPEWVAVREGVSSIDEFRWLLEDGDQPMNDAEKEKRDVKLRNLAGKAPAAIEAACNTLRPDRQS